MALHAHGNSGPGSWNGVYFVLAMAMAAAPSESPGPPWRHDHSELRRTCPHSLLVSTVHVHTTSVAPLFISHRSRRREKVKA